MKLTSRKPLLSRLKSRKARGMNKTRTFLIKRNKTIRLHFKRFTPAHGKHPERTNPFSAIHSPLAQQGYSAKLLRLRKLEWTRAFLAAVQPATQSHQPVAPYLRGFLPVGSLVKFSPWDPGFIICDAFTVNLLGFALVPLLVVISLAVPRCNYRLTQKEQLIALAAITAATPCSPYLAQHLYWPAFFLSPFLIAFLSVWDARHGGTLVKGGFLRPSKTGTFQRNLYLYRDKDAMTMALIYVVGLLPYVWEFFLYRIFFM